MPLSSSRHCPHAAAASPRSIRIARLAFLAVLALAAALRLWQLDQNGYGREYYAAGVRSMLGSFQLFFFNAFDPAGFVSLDKPPVALWMQVASAKLLGFSAFSVMLPQVLEGLASVVLVHHLVGRRFGRGAALLAAVLLALTPICVAADRSNNTDSCLIMVLLFAAWALMRAAETASGRLLALAMALVGLAFNVKMAAALVVVPTFGLAYLCGATAIPAGRRAIHLGVAGAVLAVVSLSWVTAFDLTPPDERPYAGSTRHNSMLELALLHNGLDRFMPRAGAGDAEPAARTADQASKRPALWDQTPVGLLRLATPHLAAQMGWWLPLAIAGVALGGWTRRGLRRLTPAQTDLLVWTGWALTYAAAFSLAGGVFHTYYVAVLGPPLAALAGIGGALLWTRYRDGSLRWGLPVTLLALAAWQLYISAGYTSWRLDDWRSTLLAASVIALVLTGAALLPGPRFGMGVRASAGLAGLGLLAMLALPAAWALSIVLVRPNVAAPAADITVFDGHAARPAATPLPAADRPRAARLLAFLRSQRQGERFLVAVPNATQAAPLIVRSGEPVMAVGGYLGRDPILTPDELAQKVDSGELRFAMLGGASIVPPNTERERALAHWIRTHGQRVDPALWREPPGASRPPADRQRAWIRAAQLYDLRPGASQPPSQEDRAP